MPVFPTPKSPCLKTLNKILKATDLGTHVCHMGRPFCARSAPHTTWKCKNVWVLEAFVRMQPHGDTCETKGLTKEYTASKSTSATYEAAELVSINITWHGKLETDIEFCVHANF